MISLIFLNHIVFACVYVFVKVHVLFYSTWMDIRWWQVRVVIFSSLSLFSLYRYQWSKLSPCSGARAFIFWVILLTSKLFLKASFLSVLCSLDSLLKIMCMMLLLWTLYSVPLVYIASLCQCQTFHSTAAF